MTFDMERTLMVAVALTIGYESRGFTLRSTILFFLGGIIGGILADLGRGAARWVWQVSKRRMTGNNRSQA